MANKWEIWLANVKFDDDPNSVKRRPVLVLDHNVAYILSVKITSHAPRPNFKGEYALKFWKIAGLAKPSTARLSKKLRLRDTDLVRKIGRLHPVDIIYIQKLL